MTTERRTPLVQTRDYITNSFTYAQSDAWQELVKYGWELFAVRNTESQQPTTLIKAPNRSDPNNRNIRIFRRDGKVDFTKPVNVRKRGEFSEFDASA